MASPDQGGAGDVAGHEQIARRWSCRPSRSPVSGRGSRRACTGSAPARWRRSGRPRRKPRSLCSAADAHVPARLVHGQRAEAAGREARTVLAAATDDRKGQASEPRPGADDPRRAMAPGAGLLAFVAVEAQVELPKPDRRARRIAMAQEEVLHHASGWFLLAREMVAGSLHLPQKLGAPALVPLHQRSRTGRPTPSRVVGETAMQSIVGPEEDGSADR